MVTNHDSATFPRDILPTGGARIDQVNLGYRAQHRAKHPSNEPRMGLKSTRITEPLTSSAKSLLDGQMSLLSVRIVKVSILYNFITLTSIATCIVLSVIKGYNVFLYKTVRGLAQLASARGLGP